MDLALITLKVMDEVAGKLNLAVVLLSLVARLGFGQKYVLVVIVAVAYRRVIINTWR